MDRIDRAAKCRASRASASDVCRRQGRRRNAGSPAAALDRLRRAVRASLGELFRRRASAAAASWCSLGAGPRRLAGATSLYRVQPDEQGVVLRFGQWVATTEPGLHVHLPYPIETVLLPKVTQVNQVQLGVRLDAGPGDPASGRERPDADRRREHRRGGLRGVLEDPRRRRSSCSGSTIPSAAVKIAAEGALRDVISRTPIQAAMSDKRQQIADETQAVLQKLLDSEHAGVEITQVQLQRVEPPLAVIDAFNDVQRARADQERGAQRGRGLRQRHPAARARRRRAHPPGRRGLQDSRSSISPMARPTPSWPVSELSGRQGRDRLAALSRKRRRNAEESRRR